MKTPASVLIVEDEIIIARDLEVRLKGLGYEVAGIATSGADALRLAADTSPSLVLMDIVLKGSLDGIETAARIREELLLPVIYLTAYTDPETLARARITEPFGYIVKPFSERELHANIEMALYKHRAAARLRQIDRWFADELTETASAVIQTDLEGHVLYLNEAAEAITAWPLQRAVGQPIDTVVRLAHRATSAPVTLSEADDSPAVHLADDTVLVDRDNRRVPVDVTACWLRDEAERPTGRVAVLRDVSGERRGSVAKLTSDIALATAQGITLQGMLQLCAQSIAQNLHAAFARIWTLNASGDGLLLRASAGQHARVDGTHARVRIGQGEVGLVAEQRALYLTNDLVNDPRASERDWARREGVVAFAGYPLLVDSRLVGVMAVYARQQLGDRSLDALTAIATTIAVGIDRKRLEEQLRLSQRLEAVGRLAGGIAHDFNNLLTIIGGCSEMLLSSTSLSNDDGPLVQDIARASGQAAALTRQLLVFSRRQPIEAEPVDLPALVANTKRMLHRLIGEDIVLTTSFPEPLSVMADPGHLEQILLNLAINARDAMPLGGRLTIEARHATLDDALVAGLPDVAPGRFAVLSIRDTGVGMTPEVAARAFEPFYTTKEPGRGTGLGLATVYGIVKQSGGHITLYSEPGTGTVFRVYLPLAPDAQTAPAEAGASAPRELPHGTETILLVEDEEAVRNLAAYVLERCGYTVLTARDGVEALRVAAAHKGEVALLITDVVMPLLAGRPLADQLALLRPGVRVLYMSGYTDDAVLRHGVMGNGSAFLQKPFLPSALATRVREVLDRPPSAA